MAEQTAYESVQLVEVGFFVHSGQVDRAHERVLGNFQIFKIFYFSFYNFLISFFFLLTVQKKRKGKQDESFDEYGYK